MNKRIISIALTVLMCLSVFSLSVLATPAPDITVSYDSGEVTYTGSGLSPNTNYRFRLVNTTGSYLVVMTQATSDAYGNIKTTVTSGTLNLSDSYSVYCEFSSSGTPEVDTSTINSGPTLYYIVIQDDGNGTGSAVLTATAGTTITLTDIPNAGHQLKEWEAISGVSSVGGSSFTMPADNVVVKAVFEVIPLAVPAISATYLNGVVTYAGSNFSASTDYNVRVVDTTPGAVKLISMTRITSDASGNISDTHTVGLLTNPTYAVYVDNLSGSLEAQTILTITTVNAQAPIITTQPASTTVAVGGTATLSVSANVGDGGTLSYQWYRNTTNSTSGGTLVGSNANYSVPTTTAGTYYYYVVVTNTNNSVSGTKTATTTSSVATVTVST